jgi:diguanylate cyclase (GGDEF)-like protein
VNAGFRRLVPEILRRRQPRTAALVGIVLLTVLGALDHFTGRDVDFFILYLFPVLLVTWFGSRRLGEIFSIVGALESVLADHLLGIYSSSAILSWNMLVRLTFFVIVVALVDRLRSVLEYEATLSSTDPLTGVSNRRSFNKRIDGELRRARRYCRPLSLVYVDIDDLKSVNDRAGHAAGDKLLKGVADVLRKTVRASDVPARLGGDEFVVVLPELSHERAKEFVGRLNDVLMEASIRHDWPVTFSKGVVTFNRPPESGEAALREAGTAMYRAKLEGKNRAVYVHFGDSRGATASSVMRGGKEQYEYRDQH